MINSAPSWPGDLDSVARQYWTLWGDALRQAGMSPPAATAAPDWQQQAMGFWSQFMPKPVNPLQDAIDRIQHQAGQWYAQMQQVAGRFAGHAQNPADITQAWREALGANVSPEGFADHFRSMLGQGRGQGLDEWMQQARPYIEAIERESARWLNAPTFGLAREHQERWQAFALAQQEYQRHSNEFNGLMLKTAEGAFQRFEQLLAGYAEPGKQITSARGLFDVWIDAAEQSYADIAMTEEFREVYGAMTNAQMRVRLAVQRETEQICTLLGVPTRTEVDAAHRKVVELERLLRKQARQAGAGNTAAAPAPVADEAVGKPVTRRRAAAAPVTRTTARRASKTAAKATAKPAAKKTATRKAATGKAASKATKSSTAKAADKTSVKAAVGKSTRATRKTSAGSKSNASSSTKAWVARNRSAAPSATKKVKTGKAKTSKTKTGKGARR